MATQVEPEVYWLPSSSYLPNSRYPVLVYRNVVPTDQGPEAIKAVVEKNKWLARGTWGHIPKMHYHTTTHECYAPISGSTTVCYGIWESDDPEKAVKFDLRVGDVEVHPAGTGHSHVESTPDYKYFGFYPEAGHSFLKRPNTRLTDDRVRRQLTAYTTWIS